MRVLIVTARFFPEHGGTEIHSHEVAQRLARAGLDTTILTTSLTSSFPPVSYLGDVRVLTVRAWPSRRDYYLAPGLVRAISATRPDILHCQGYHTLVAPLVMGTALAMGIPYVVTLHSGGHPARHRRAIRPLQARVLRPLLTRANRIVAVSRFEADLFARRLGLPASEFTIIPSGVDLPPGLEDDAQLPSEPRSQILSIGRVERYKGHHRVLEALPALRQVRPDLRLRIVGTGSFEQALRQMATDLGVSDQLQIKPVPAEQRGEMRRLLQSAGVVTALSDYESQGLAVHETLALGRPLLVSSNSSLGELVRYPNVRALPSHAGPGEVKAAILELLDAPPTTPPRLPTWDDCASDLLELYRQLVS
jgi:glycosyltransferase involved in cell wall biosynthesis